MMAAAPALPIGPIGMDLSAPVAVPHKKQRRQASGPAAPQQTRFFNWEKLWLGVLVLGLLAALLVAIALPVGALLGHSFWAADGKFSGLAQYIA